MVIKCKQILTIFAYKLCLFLDDETLPLKSLKKKTSKPSKAASEKSAKAALEEEKKKEEEYFLAQESLED